MRVLTILLLVFMVVFDGAAQTGVQEKQAVVLSSIVQSAETIRVNITSPQPFYAGGNRYMLHIGDMLFYRVEQKEEHKAGYLNFLISLSEFEMAKNGSNVYLTYGLEEAQEKELEKLSNGSKICWYLGKWDKGKLTR